jgi:hypothetical protein
MKHAVLVGIVRMSGANTMSDIDPMQYARMLDAHHDHGAPPPPGYTPPAGQQPAQPPQDAPHTPDTGQPVAKQPEDLVALEARLRAQHDQRVRGDRERDDNEEILRRVLGNAYRPLPKADSTNTDAPRTRRDGSPLTELDKRLAIGMTRLFPYLDLGARVPPAYRR